MCTRITLTSLCGWCCVLLCVAVIEVNARTRGRQGRNYNRQQNNDGNRNQGGRGDRVVSSLPMFPNKNSWCETRPIQQIVDHPGCTSKTIDNMICMGQCYSYSIPRTLPEETTAALQYCDSCRPSRATWQKISLECTIDKVPYVDKLVEIVQECDCRSCHGTDDDML